MKIDSVIEAVSKFYISIQELIFPLLHCVGRKGI